MKTASEEEDHEMTERVIDRVREHAEQLRTQGAEAEKIGKLTDDTVKLMKSAGNIRLLQPTDHGGLQVHPRVFRRVGGEIQEWQVATHGIPYSKSRAFRWIAHNDATCRGPMHRRCNAIPPTVRSGTTERCLTPGILPALGLRS